jgi:hypothetical protein
MDSACFDPERSPGVGVTNGATAGCPMRMRSLMILIYAAS